MAPTVPIDDAGVMGGKSGSLLLRNERVLDGLDLRALIVERRAGNTDATAPPMEKVTT